MNVMQKFNDIITYKEYEFHDSSLNEMKLNLEFGKLELSIELCKYNDKKDEDEVLLILFVFKNIIILSNTINLKSDKKLYEYTEIDDFYCIEENGKYVFYIEGIAGWQLSFISDEFNYTEQLINKYKYN